MLCCEEDSLAVWAMEAIDSLEEGGSVVDESRLSGWAHALIASTVVAAVLVVWRLTQWRRDHDLAYARVQLYEDRPFAYAGCESELGTPASGLGHNKPMHYFGCSEHSVTPLRGGSLQSPGRLQDGWDDDDDVHHTQRLIRDALQEEPPLTRPR